VKITIAAEIPHVYIVQGRTARKLDRILFRWSSACEGEVGKKSAVGFIQTLAALFLI